MTQFDHSFSQLRSKKCRKTISTSCSLQASRRHHKTCCMVHVSKRFYLGLLYSIRQNSTSLVEKPKRWKIFSSQFASCKLQRGIVSRETCGASFKKVLLRHAGQYSMQFDVLAWKIISPCTLTSAWYCTKLGRAHFEKRWQRVFYVFHLTFLAEKKNSGNSETVRGYWCPFFSPTVVWECLKLQSEN